MKNPTILNRSFNEADARKFYKLLHHCPDEFTELRAFLPNVHKPPQRAWVQNADDFVAFCRKWNKNRLVYVGLNPRKAYGVGKAEHISRIIGIPFDVDAEHLTDTSSTNAEKAAAYIKLGELKKLLAERGFKPPYIDDSGNGYHLIQWVDMSFTDLEDMKARLNEFFLEIKITFPDLDSVWGPARVLKVPGTWALKGPGTEERPHRQAEILEDGDPDPDQGLAEYILGLEVDVPHAREEAAAPPTVEKEKKKRQASPSWNKKWDRKRPVNIIRPFLSAMEADVRLNNLYRAVNHKGEKLTEEDIKEEYGSRSEAEFYIIIRAFYHRLLPGEIPRFMAGCQIGKWQKETQNYQNRTIKAAWWAFRSDINRFFTQKGRFVAMWMAEEIQERYRFVATGERSKVWTYNSDKGIWENDGAELIHEEATTLLEARFRSIYISETIAYVRYTNYIDIIKLGGSTGTLVVKNGVINLNTNKLGPFDPELFEITSIPVTYDPDATCQKIIKFLEEVLEPENFDMIIEIFGYCLLKSYPIARMIIFTGSGANGKTQLINILKNFLGNKNTSKLTLQQIANSTFLPAQLQGKLANLAADIPSTPIHYTGIVKTLTGGDELTAQHKYFAPFDFMNYAKLIFSCNEVPPSDDTTPAWLRRPILVDFLKVFLAGNPGTILDLGNKISTPKELSGLLNLALAGLKRLLEQGQFTGEPTLEEREEKFIRESNPVQYFATRFVEMSPNTLDKIDKSQLYKKYALLCQALGKRPVESNKFSMKIKVHLPYIDEGDYDKVTGKTKKGKLRTRKTRCWYGIRLKAEKLTQEMKKLQTAQNVNIATIDPIPPKYGNKNKNNYKYTRDGKYRSDDDENAPPGHGTIESDLFDDAIRVLEEHDGRMQQQDLFKVLIKLGYHIMQMNQALRGDNRFIFMGMNVKLGAVSEEEAS